MAHPLPVARAVVSFALAAGVLAASIPVLAQAPQRVLFVSVTDKAGKPVESVGPSDLVIREDKVLREVLSVTPAVEPMQVALLIDNATAANPFIQYYREALTAFVTAFTDDTIVDGKHQIAVISLASRPTIVQDYTTDKPRLLKAVNGIFAMPDTGTYLLDGILETSSGLAKRTAARPVFVAVVTNGPDLSDRPYDRVLTALKTAGASLYVIKVGPAADQSHDRAMVVDQGPRNSGGRYDEIFTGTGLTPAMKQLADELLHQFKVSYVRPQALIPPETITVEAAKPDLKARGIPLRTQPEPGKR